jgi:CRP/FNR family transcriptional regulator, cyclic AMP receptor protein
MTPDQTSPTSASPRSAGDPDRRVRRSAGINTAFRAIKAQHASNRSPMEVMADRMIGVASATPFLVIHAIIFMAWIWWNLPISGLPNFDPYPFGMLTMCVSLEAIFLSVIVLLSQNRQSAKDRIRADVDYEVNLKAELEVSHLHEKVDHLHAVLLSKLHQIEIAARR